MSLAANTHRALRERCDLFADSLPPAQASPARYARLLRIPSRDPSPTRVALEAPECVEARQGWSVVLQAWVASVAWRLLRNRLTSAVFFGAVVLAAGFAVDCLTVTVFDSLLAVAAFALSLFNGDADLDGDGAVEPLVLLCALLPLIVTGTLAVLATLPTGDAVVFEGLAAFFVSVLLATLPTFAVMREADLVPVAALPADFADFLVSPFDFPADAFAGLLADFFRLTMAATNWSLLSVLQLETPKRLAICAKSFFV